MTLEACESFRGFFLFETLKEKAGAALIKLLVGWLFFKKISSYIILFVRLSAVLVLAIITCTLYFKFMELDFFFFRGTEEVQHFK